VSVADASGRLVTLAPLVKGVPSSLNRHFQQVAWRALQQITSYRLTSRRLVNGQRLQVILGCPRWGVSCIQKIGKTLRADWIFFGRLSRKGRRVKIGLGLLHVSTRKIRGWKMETVPLQRASMIAALDRALYRLFGFLRGPGLQVRSNVSGARVLLGGRFIGRTPLLRVSGLPQGQVVLQIAARGYVTESQTIVLKAGHLLQQESTLSRTPPRRVALVRRPVERRPVERRPLVGRPTKTPPPRRRPGASVPLVRQWWL